MNDKEKQTEQLKWLKLDDLQFLFLAVQRLSDKDLEDDEKEIINNESTRRFYMM